jgi:hypothetical protein
VILDFVLDVIGSLLEFVWTDWRPSPRWRVKRALRLARKRHLSAKRREFAVTWLKFGLDNLDDLGLEPREPALRTALERVQRAQGDQR